MDVPLVRWLTVLLDEPAGEAARAARFWADLTGTSPSPSRGGQGELSTLVPDRGDAHLRVQATGAGTSASHLHLHVDDVDEAEGHAIAVGAEVLHRGGYVVLRSPGGLAFCLVPHQGEGEAAAPTTWPGGHRSRLDQLTVDVAHDVWEPELRFWHELTDWEVTATSRPELARLRTPPRLPVRVLLQRRRRGRTTAHVDLATDDRHAEVQRLEALGARRLAHGPTWTVVEAPHGATLCVTERDPDTGLLR